MDQLISVGVDGVIYSAWLFTAALGLTLIYGVMKIVNVTHGSFYALGAYAAASLTGAWLAAGFPPMLSYVVLLAAALLVSTFFSLNLLLLTLNLIPFPPLDGAGALPLVLGERLAERWRALTAQPFAAILGLIVAWNLIGPLFRVLHRMALNLLFPGAGYS